MNNNITLHRFPFSNFCEKVNWTFERKKIPHNVVEHLPFKHMRPLKKLSGQTAVPVIETGNGEIITGSADIIDHLEAMVPQYSLYPHDRALKTQALEWQARLDAMGAAVRGAMFYDYLQDKSFFHKMITDGGAGGVSYKVMFYAMSPVLASMLKKKEPDPEVFRRTITQMLDEIAQTVGSGGYLVGNQFSVADLTAASLLYPLCYPQGTVGAEIARSTATGSDWLARWEGHEVLSYIEAIYRQHRHN